MTPMERYEYLKSQHRCVRCRTQDAYTLSGRAFCAECAEKRSVRQRLKYREDSGASEKQRQRKIRIEREQNGMCTRCGKRPSISGRKMCAKCTAYSRRHDEERRVRDGAPSLQQRLERPADGKCWCCGKPTKPGLNQNFMPYRVCERCYQNAAEAAAKGRESIRKTYDTRVWDRTGIMAKRGGPDGAQPERTE